jgi:3-hydroxyacyl-[acyl-carrier-protein] dehydratase
MILRDDFFSIIQHESAVGSVKAKIRIDKAHRIFDGHFPSVPIVPGVCMVQIILELMETSTGLPVGLATADNIKFLTVINPRQNTDIDVGIAYTGEAGNFAVAATLFSGSVTFFKLKATLKPA